MKKTNHYLGLIFDNLYDCPSYKSAIVTDDREISYEELGRIVLTYSQYINSAIKEGSKNKKPVVAICLKKGPEFVYCTLACALLGYIWVPIDIESPSKRIEYQLTNSQASLIISEFYKNHHQSIPHLFIEGISQNNDERAYGNFLKRQTDIDREIGYYLYTSGSTGLPKCVALNHEATNHVFYQTIENWSLQKDDIFFAVTPFHHDMSLFDIFVPLILGATLVIPVSSEIKDPEAWASIVQKYRVSIWVSVPAIVDMLYALANPQQLKSLRVVAQGGDTIPPKLIHKIRKYNPYVSLYSLGGPTETTIWSIWHPISVSNSETIPYGIPLTGTEYYLLDDNLQPCPTGQVGTMYVAGINLSNGYIVEGELVDIDFVEYPSVQHKDQDCLNETLTRTRLYKTSDTGWLRGDGNIIFSGRKDGYIKIKGVRISAYEVELGIQGHPDIQQAVVLACHNPSYDLDELIAFYSLKKNSLISLSLKELREHLKQALPESHIPTRWKCLQSFPLTINGKIDRQALHSLATEILNGEIN